MKQAGDKVQVITFRPGERMYGSDYKIIERTPMYMLLVMDKDSKIQTSIHVISKNELHDDQLRGSPKVRVIDRNYNTGGHQRGDEVYTAYFYELGDNIFLILL